MATVTDSILKIECLMMLSLDTKKDLHAFTGVHSFKVVPRAGEVVGVGHLDAVVVSVSHSVANDSIHLMLHSDCEPEEFEAIECQLAKDGLVNVKTKSTGKG